MGEQHLIRIGTRASKLATWQAQWVAGQLRDAGNEVDVVFLKTEGDVSTKSLGEIGGQGVFTKSIQRALLEDRVDLAVHSLKDLPTERIAGLRLAASPPRERLGDALVCGAAGDIDDLPSGARVGTGSARRQAQLRHKRPDLQVADIRGNVDTRLAKLDAGDYDALILAEAGLHRLGLAERIVQVLPKTWMLPAIGQGALGLETRDDDETTREAVGVLNDAATMQAVLAERALLRTLQAGCLAPVGAWARFEQERLRLTAAVLSVDGTERLVADERLAEDVEATAETAERLGAAVAEQLLQQGAERLIKVARD